MSVLITFIGIGSKKDDGTTGYREADYIIGDKTITTWYFAHAIINSGEYDFSKIIVIDILFSPLG